MSIITEGGKAGSRLAVIRLSAGTITALLLGASCAAAGNATPNEGELHTARCIAALEVKADDLARRVKAGRIELRPLLISTLDAGAAFIGQAYLQGQRDEERSQTLRMAALEEQKVLAEADLVARQSACAKEGTRLLSESDMLGRLVINRLVDRRMQKLLGD